MPQRNVVSLLCHNHHTTNRLSIGTDMYIKKKKKCISLIFFSVTTAQHMAEPTYLQSACEERFTPSCLPESLDCVCV